MPLETHCLWGQQSFRPAYFQYVLDHKPKLHSIKLILPSQTFEVRRVLSNSIVSVSISEELFETCSSVYECVGLMDRPLVKVESEQSQMLHSWAPLARAFNHLQSTKKIKKVPNITHTSCTMETSWDRLAGHVVSVRLCCSLFVRRKRTWKC